MAKRDPKLLVQPAPLLVQGMTTPKAMRDVWYALMPATLAGLWFFGLSALLVLLASIAGTLATEWMFTERSRRRVVLGDSSAALTGLLLGLTLPPALPLWMAFLGGVVAIGLGKIIWGGLGANLFNPALLGRAFLLGTFPIAMTTCRLLSLDEANGVVQVASIDAFDATPVLDLKAYFPVCDRVQEVPIPEWLSDWPDWMPEEGIDLEPRELESESSS